MRFSEDHLYDTYVAEYNRALYNAGIALSDEEQAKLREGLGIAAEAGAKLEWAAEQEMIREIWGHIEQDLDLWLEARGE